MALRPRVRRLLSTDRTPIPRHLSEITRRGDEAQAAEAGLDTHTVETVWRAAGSLYRAGIPRPDQPMQPDSLYRPDEILKVLCDARPSGFNTQAYHAITAGFVLGSVVENVTGTGPGSGHRRADEAGGFIFELRRRRHSGRGGGRNQR